MQTAIKAVKDLNDFAKILESEKTRDLLELAKKNRAENPEGITGWMVTQHEDWLDVQGEGPLIISVPEETETLTAEGVYNEETIRKILANFQNSHIGIETSFTKNDFNNIKVFQCGAMLVFFRLTYRSISPHRLISNLKLKSKSMFKNLFP